MENNDIRQIWKNVEADLGSLHRDELGKILAVKIHKVRTGFYLSTSINLLIMVSYFTFLVIALMNRWDDVYYRINNLLIGGFTLVALVSEGIMLRMLKKNNRDLSQKEWLERSIHYLRRELKQRISWYIVPVLAVLSMLSIHIYFSQERFTDIFMQPENLWGIALGLVIGLTVAYLFICRYRKAKRKKLRYLEGLLMAL